MATIRSGLDLRNQTLGPKVFRIRPKSSDLEGTKSTEERRNRVDWEAISNAGKKVKRISPTAMAAGRQDEAIPYRQGCSYRLTLTGLSEGTTEELWHAQHLLVKWPDWETSSGARSMKNLSHPVAVKYYIPVFSQVTCLGTGFCWHRSAG